MTSVELIAYFNEHNLKFDVHSHVAVFTTAEGDHVKESIPGAHSKNLFLKDKKKNYILVSVLDHKRVDLKALSDAVGLGRFSFCNECELLQFVGVTPGSVTPYGLIHDTQGQVRFFLDRDFLDHDWVNFHPLRNDQTVCMNRSGFLSFFEGIKHKPTIIDIPVLD